MSGLIAIIEGTQPNQGIPLATRRGTHIDNYQIRQPLSPFQHVGIAALERLHRPPGVVFKGSPDPIYNCHGMVFASRRTCIAGPDEVPVILQEDGYVLVPNENAQPGDVLVYYDADGAVTHSALVLEIMRMEGSEQTIPKVLSKWAWGKEAVHNAYMSAYGVNFRCFRINP